MVGHLPNFGPLAAAAASLVRNINVKYCIACFCKGNKFCFYAGSYVKLYIYNLLLNILIISRKHTTF